MILKRRLNAHVVVDIPFERYFYISTDRFSDFVLGRRLNKANTRLRLRVVHAAKLNSSSAKPSEKSTSSIDKVLQLTKII